MIRTSCENDTAFIVCIQPCDGFFAFFAHVFSCMFQFVPGFVYCMINFTFRNVGEFFCKNVENDFFITEGEERIVETHVSATDFLHVIFDIFRIGCNNRTVVMIACARYFIALIEKGRIEDIRNTLLNQPCNMSVRQFGRITF